MKINSKHQVLFTMNAWLKMSALVMNSSDEICWHGLMKKLNNYSYIVYDILVHPQTVTGATVRVDDAEYAQWMNELSDEEFENMRFEGHSHVNMSVNPSGQDTDTEVGIATSLPEGGVYIFVIMNKRQELKFRIYKKENGEVKNATFENYSILLGSGETDAEYASKEMENKVKKHKYSLYNNSFSKNATTVKSKNFAKEALKEELEFEELYGYDEYPYGL